MDSETIDTKSSESFGKYASYLTESMTTFMSVSGDLLFLDSVNHMFYLKTKDAAGSPLPMRAYAVKALDGMQNDWILTREELAGLIPDMVTDAIRTYNRNKRKAKEAAKKEKERSQAVLG